MNYFIIINERTGKPIVTDARLPIYYIKSVAKQFATRFHGSIVRTIDSSHLEGIIGVFEVNTDIQECVKFCSHVCDCWNVSFEWVIENSRAKYRPIMRQLLYLLLMKKFPGIKQRELSALMNQKSHTTISKALPNIRKWISVNDPLVMQYYEPIKHFFDERSTESATA